MASHLHQWGADGMIIDGQIYTFIDGKLYPLDDNGYAQGWHNSVPCASNGNGQGMLLFVR